MFWLITGILISGIILLLLFSNIKIFLHYSFDGHENFLQVRGKACFGLLSFKRTILPKMNEEKVKSREHLLLKQEGTLQANEREADQMEQSFATGEAPSLLQQVDRLFDYLGIFYDVFKLIKIKQFIWNSEIGTGDAAATGIATGAGWAIKGNVIAIIRQVFVLETVPRVQVYANFQSSVVRTNFHCMVQVKVGQTILASIKALRLFRKLKNEQRIGQGSVKKEQTV